MLSKEPPQVPKPPTKHTNTKKPKAVSINQRLGPKIGPITARLGPTLDSRLEPKVSKRSSKRLDNKPNTMKKTTLVQSHKKNNLRKGKHGRKPDTISKDTLDKELDTFMLQDETMTTITVNQL